MALGRAHARVRPIAVIGALALAAGMVAILAPTAVGGPAPCQTKNVRTGVEYKGATPVATAISEASAGDTINVWGTCVGNFQVGKSLTLKGQGKNATLDGGGAATVLHITDGTTTVDGLKITNGAADVSSPDNGGDCCVGGGIAVSGPIDTDFGTITLTGSTVSGNTVTNGSAGGIWNFGGTVTLNNSTISGNSAANPSTTLARGGGIRNQSALAGTVVVSQATLTLSGATKITGNQAEQGGGISNRPSSTVLASNWTGSISGNTPDQCNPTLTIGSTTCGA